MTGHTWSQGQESQGAAASACPSGVYFPWLCHLQPQGCEPLHTFGIWPQHPRTVSSPPQPALHGSGTGAVLPGEAGKLCLPDSSAAPRRFRCPKDGQSHSGSQRNETRAPAELGRGSSTSSPCRDHCGQCSCPGCCPSNISALEQQ